MADDEIPPEVEARLRAQSSKYHDVKKQREERTEDKNITPTVEGKVIIRNRGFASKVRDFFTHDDSQSIGEYVFMDVILPAVRDLIFESINAGSEKMLYGDIVASRGSRVSSRGRTPYDQISTNKIKRSQGRYSSDPRSEMSRVGRKTHDFKEIILESRQEAESVIADMYGLLDRFQMVTVADLYDLLGSKSDTDFIDLKWGWTDLNGAKAARVRGGYMLILPPTEELD